MPDCNTCKEKRHEVDPVPYIVHEAAMARNERNNKRMIFSLILAIAFIFISNATWLYAWMQYDYTSEQTVTVEGKDGIASYINGGSIINGESNSKENQIPDEKKQ